MEIIKEEVGYENPLLSLKVFQNIRNVDATITWHYHPELEMLLVKEGRLDVDIGDDYYSLNAGDVAIIGSSQLHRDRSFGNPLRYTVLQFDLDQFFDHSTIPYMRYFAEAKHPLSRANYIFQENPEVKRHIAETIEQIHLEAFNKTTGYELAVSMLIKKILLLLLRNDPRKVLAERDNFDRIRLKPVLDYVEERLTDRIQVDEVCSLANMSYYYFVKFFKKSVGLSFTEYVNYRKIKWAERILLTKDLSISEVGEQIGMPNMAHFYKMFKKYNNCSPKEFQKRMLSWEKV
ncbi:AraC family transcriptional regulator [Paenibacillaceae bacterium]|nr:AraC family transcriptional regulator [Paenibacillaceae bacterium]